MDQSDWHGCHWQLDIFTWSILGGKKEDLLCGCVYDKAPRFQLYVDHC